MKRPLQHVVRVCLFLGCSGLLPFLCISVLRWSLQDSIPDPSNPITSPSERGLPGFNTDPSTTTSCEDCSLPARRLATDHHADADATLTSSPAPAFWPRNMGDNAGTGSVRPYPHAITRMCVIGERNSGTNWVEKTLNMNFPGAQPLRSGMASSNCYRHKHWFHFPHLMEPLVEDGDLIFVLFRNALDWLLHFSASPHHAHNHHGLPMHDFLTRPWTGRPDNDTCSTEPRQWMFAHPQYEPYRAVYGGPYPEGPIRDVLQLRAMKIDNFLRLPQWMPAGHDRVIFLRYEDLIRGDAQGFRNLILELKAHFRIAGLCPKDRMPPLVSMGYKGSDYDPVSLMRLEIGQVHHRQLVNGTALQALEAVQAFRRGADLELEERIGYTYEYLPSGSN